jgi:hypothetical protein
MERIKESERQKENVLKAYEEIRFYRSLLGGINGEEY